MSQAKAVSLRFGIMAIVVLVAALSFEFLGNVESIVGAVCSMSSSMLLPAFFFLRYNAMANQICQNMLSSAQVHPVAAYYCSRVQCTCKAQRKDLGSFSQES